MFVKCHVRTHETHKGLTQKLNFVHVKFWHLLKQNGHTNDYLRTPKYYNFSCLDSQLSPFSKYQFTNLLIYLSCKQRLNVFHKLGSIPTSLASTVVVLSCFSCLLFRMIPSPFEAAKTHSGLNIIKVIPHICIAHPYCA